MAPSLSYGVGLLLILTARLNSYPYSTTTESYPYPTQNWTFWTSGLPSQDLTGRMFSMMSGSIVTLRGSPRYQDTYVFTVCLRIITDLQRVGTMFSLMMGNSATLSLRKAGDIGARGYELTVGEASKTLNPVSTMPSFGKLWPWTSLCVTWDSNTGMTQWWQDGQMSERKGMWRGQNFYGTPVMTLAGFEGQVTDIHMWDKTLPLSTLRSYNRGWGFPSGNMLNWRDMSYTSGGYAVLENAYESQRESAEEDGTRKQQQKHSQKQGRLGNVVWEGPDSRGGGCLGLRKHCGKRQVL